MPRWTDEHLEIVRRLRTVEGKSFDEIEAATGRRAAAIRSMCKERKWLLPEAIRAAFRVHSDETIEKARTLWDAGLSASEIARDLSVASKSAIISIARRHGFTKRPSPLGPKAPGTPRRPRTPRPLPLFGDVQPVRMVAGRLTTQPGPTLLQRQMRSHAGHVARREGIQMRPLPIFGPARSCQFPLWAEGERPSHQYCGKPVAIGSYCAACHAVTHRAGTALYPAWVR